LDWPKLGTSVVLDEQAAVRPMRVGAVHPSKELSLSTQNPQSSAPVQTQPNGTSTPTANARYERAVTRRTYTETKNGFKTSEFYVMLVFVAGVLLSTYADQDSLARRDGWFFAALAVGAYILSRGLAKLGTREPYDDDR
jgi:hypothetical protein